MSLKTSVVLTDEYNVVVNSEELIGTTNYMIVIAEVSHKPTSL